MKTKTILIIIVGIMRVLRVIYKVRRNAKRFNNLEWKEKKWKSFLELSKKDLTKVLFFYIIILKRKRKGEF